MAKVVRWLGLAMAGCLLLLGVAAGVLYAMSAVELGRRHDVTPRTITIRTDPATVAHGERMARIQGCTGCHGGDLGGGILAEDLMVGRLTAPNLTRVRETYSDEDLVRLIRHGVRPDGTALIPAMPSQAFHHLADDDLGAIIAYLRSVPPAEDSLPSTRIGPALRGMIALGEVRTIPDLVGDDPPPVEAPRGGDARTLGAYLARSICTECHGTALEGSTGFMVTPPLAVVGSYDPDQFRRLMREGLALGDREVGLMSEVARGRFRHYTDEEIDALYAYLSTFRRPAPVAP